MRNPVIGEICKLKGNNYMTLKINKIILAKDTPKNCILVECLCSGGSFPVNFNFALIKTFKASDLVRLL